MAKSATRTVPRREPKQSKVAEQEFDSFLSRQSEEGTACELDREFSINLIAAQQKLGRYSLPRPSAWVLKFVQAATESSCRDLSFTLGRNEIALEYSGNAFGPLSTLRDSLDSLRPQSLAEDHLFGGLLAALASGGEVFVENEGSRWYPTTQAEMQPSAHAGPSFRVVFRPPSQSFWDKLRRRLWFNTGLMEELYTNCFASPVNLSVDSRPLDIGEAEIPLLSGLISGEEGSHLDLYGQLLADTGRKTRTYCPWGSYKPHFVAYAVQIRLTPAEKISKLSIDWVRSGAVVQREELEIEAGYPMLVRILVPTRGLEFDASGFAIRECEEAVERRGKAVSYLVHGVEALKGEVRKFKRWQRFLEQNHPHAGVPKIDGMCEQLNNFLFASKRYL